ncbi:MAG: peptide deformylase [Bacilli bacterium]|nr:peptide deformylase [Bacilli bacterium]
MPLEAKNKKLLDEMLDYLRKSRDPEYRKKHPTVREGVGLAAPQTGNNLRMLVISYQVGEDQYIEYQLVNPRIVSNSVRKCYIEAGEGCLSVDEEHTGYVPRDFKIVVEAYDALLGENITITARGFDAIVLQHEIDHLNGILFYDHINKQDPFKTIPGAVVI